MKCQNCLFILVMIVVGWCLPVQSVYSKTITAESLTVTYQTFQQEGREAAVKRLDEGFAEFLEAVVKKDGEAGAFDIWNFQIWQDAQFGRGRLNPQWSGFIYEWIYNSARQKNRWDWACHVRPNLLIDLGDLGMQARCRELLFEHEDYMKRQRFTHDTRTFQQVGVWFAPFPDVFLRKFPKTISNSRHVVYWQRPEAKKDPERSILIDNMGVAMIQSMAESEWSVGLWQDSLEKLLWIQDWAAEVNRQMIDPAIQIKPVRDHADRNWRSIGNLIEQMRFLGHPEKALALADAGIAVEWSSKYGDTPRILMRCQREMVRATTGTATDESAELIKDLLEKYKNNKFMGGGELVFMKSLLLHVLDAIGRENEADQILAELRSGKLSEKECRGLEITDIRRLIRAGKYDGLESRMTEILDQLRKSESKMAEIELTMLYSDLCLGTGKFAKALMAEREVLRLIRAFNIYPLEARCLARIALIQWRAGDAAGARNTAAQAASRLSDVQAGPWMQSQVTALLDQMKQSSPSPAAGKVKEKTSALVLQPRLASSMAISKRAAKAIFTLSNPTDHPVSGVLRFEEHPVKIDWDDATAFGRVEVVMDAATATAPEQRVELAAGEVATFQTVLPPDDQTKGVLNLKWTEVPNGASTSVWSFDPAEENVDFAVIDAGVYESSPFHQVPVYHHLQMKPGDRPNLRVVSSVPARIEFYAGGKLAMVDAQGNGSLRDEGDQIAWDDDRDGWPEVTADAHGEAVIQLYAHALQAIPAEGLELRIEWKNGDQWTEVAKDRIMPAK